MKYIGIIGSRTRNSWEDYQCIKKKFTEIFIGGDIIVSGGCGTGGDNFAETIARNNDIRIIIFKADWDKYGKEAGFIRNNDIAKISDTIIACVSENRKGGTEDTIRKFKDFHPEGKVYLV